MGDVHNLYVVVGSEYQKTRFDIFNATGTDFTDPFFIQEGLITGSFNTQNSSGLVGEEGFASIFGRFNYDFDNRYLLSVSVRRDAISNLPPSTREDWFLGASVGWNIAEENFFNSDVIGSLKLRAGWAETGNTAGLDLFPALGIYGPELYGDLKAIRFENVGNPDLRWETTTKSNLGLDFSILDNRISGSVDYFFSETEDLILEAPTSPVLGVPENRIFQNVGILENSGIEFAINAAVINNDNFSYNINFNATHARNEITACS